MKSPKEIELSEEIKGRNKYLSLAKALLKKDKEEEAILIFKHAIKEMPDDPFILSYYGCLTAIVEKKASAGVKFCREAIEKLKRSQPLGEFIYPVFYLNLGRCYMAGGNKKKALEVFNQGLRMDAGYPDLILEIKKLGLRKKPPISFLPRGNLLNKYIGLLLSKIKD